MTIADKIARACASFTNEEKIAWRQTFAMPTMEKGMFELQKLATVSGQPEMIGPGYDVLTIAAATLWFVQGQQSILDAIEAFGTESPPPPKPLPDAFRAPSEYREQRR